MLNKELVDRKLKIIECVKLFLSGTTDINKISKITNISVIDVERYLNDKYIADLYGIKIFLNIKKTLYKFN